MGTNFRGLATFMKIKPQKSLYTQKSSNNNYSGGSLTHENLFPWKFNPQNIVTTKIYILAIQ